MAACETPNRVQSCGTGVQVSSRHHSVMSYPSDDCQLVTELGRQHRWGMCSASEPDTDKAWQQKFRGGRVTVMELFAVLVF